MPVMPLTIPLSVNCQMFVAAGEVRQTGAFCVAGKPNSVLAEGLIIQIILVVILPGVDPGLIAASITVRAESVYYELRSVLPRLSARPRG